MKRRTKLSLTRNTANHKRARVTEVPQQRHRINEPPSPPPCSNSIPTTCASKFVIGEQELITSKGQEEANPSDSDDLGPSTNPTAVDYGKSLATPDGDCGVSSSQPDCPMSCGSVDVNHVFVDAAAGSGHQMETECTEEDINDTDSVLPPPCVSVADSEQISDFMEDVLTDPIFESEIDLCTQHGPSNSAHYTPPNDETFNMPHRVHRKSPATRQTSLLSFMSTTTSSIHVSTSVPIINSQDNHECQTACTSSARSLTGRGNGAFPVSKSLTETQAVEFSQGIKTQNRVKRTCPFFKRVPGTDFSVDAFSYGSIPNCSAYFLSHFHADHYMGLTKKFQHPIYCSKITANLVKQQLRVSQQYVHPLDMNTPHVIDGVEVTLLDANHCPGSVLFLFRLVSSRHYLHTGDFRFCTAMKSYPQLVNISIHQLFLDTTYCSPQYTFPRQEEVIAFAVDKAAAAVHTDPGTLIVCGTYTIGKEKVFMGLARTLGLKVFVRREKKVILECLESPEILSVLTTDPRSAGLHVLPMGKLNMNDLSLYLEEWSSKFSSIVAFKPTGWTYSSKNASLAAIKPQTRGPVTIYGIPYSEHSSFSELRQFVQFLHPQRIIPTVNNHSPKKRDEMQQYFRQWLTGPSQSQTKQTKLNMSAFKRS